MERKIGEIFGYNGEWYQCLKSASCDECAFSNSNCIDNPSLKCSVDDRTDNYSVIFKKLEKFGEPYISSRNKKRYQLYRCFCLPIITKDRRIEIEDANWVGIEIKQSKEDMEEYKTPLPKEDNPLTRVVYAYVNGKISDNELIKSIKEMSDEYPFEKNNLKPFSLEEAKQGKPVCTRDGRKARIICFDVKGDKPIIALIEYEIDERPCNYFANGKFYSNPNENNDADLMMLPEKKEGWVNVYKDGLLDTRVYNTKKEAFDKASPRDYVDTVRISWEESE